MFRNLRQKRKEKKFAKTVSDFSVPTDLNVNKSIIYLLKEYIMYLEQIRANASKILGTKSNREKAALFAIFYNFLSIQKNIFYFYNKFNEQFIDNEYAKWYIIQKELPVICENYRKIVLKEDVTINKSEIISEEDFMELYNDYRIIYNPKLLQDTDFILKYFMYFIFFKDYPKCKTCSTLKNLDSYDIFNEFDDIKSELQNELQKHETITLHLFTEKEIKKLAIANFLKEIFFKIAFVDNMVLGKYVYLKKF
jgi:hypothetical protein